MKVTQAIAIIEQDCFSLEGRPQTTSVLSYDLRLDLVTSIVGLDLHIVKMYLCTKSKVSRSRL